MQGTVPCLWCRVVAVSAQPGLCAVWGPDPAVRTGGGGGQVATAPSREQRPDTLRVGALLAPQRPLRRGRWPPARSGVSPGSAEVCCPHLGLHRSIPSRGCRSPFLCWAHGCRRTNRPPETARIHPGWGGQGPRAPSRTPASGGGSHYVPLVTADPALGAPPGPAHGAGARLQRPERKRGPGKQPAVPRGTGGGLPSGVVAPRIRRP